MRHIPATFVLLVCCARAVTAAPPLSIVTATRFGGTGDDLIEDVCFAGDGTLYVTGTLAAPPVGLTPAALAMAVEKSAYGRGYVAHLSADGTRVLASAVFAAGSVKPTSVQATAGGVYVAGYSAGGLEAALAPLGGVHRKPPTTAPAGKLFTPPEHHDEPKFKAGTDQRGAPFVVRLPADLSKIDAGTFLEGWQSLWHVPRPLNEDHYQPVCLAALSTGDVVVTHDGGYNLDPPAGRPPGTFEFYAAKDHVSRLSADLTVRRWTFDFTSPEVNPARAAKGLGAEWTLPYMGNPRIFRLRADANDNLYVSGWSCSRTTREPWWSPFLRKYSADGKLAWKAWEHDPTSGGDGRLDGDVSDAFVRSVAVDDDGHVLASLTGDGGNNVLLRDAVDYTKSARNMKSRLFGFRGRILFWGGVARINGETREHLGGDTFDTAIGPKDRVPDGPLRGMAGRLPSWANDIAPTVGGGVLAAGRDYGYLKLSPDALYRGSGSFVRLFDKNWSDVYTSAVPDVHLNTAARHKNRYAIIGATIGDAAPVSGNALQRKPGGDRDGYLLIVEVTR